MKNEKSNFHDYEIHVFDENDNGTMKYVARIERISKRARGGRKRVFAYWYRTPEKRDKVVVDWMIAKDKEIQEKQGQKAKVKAIRDNFVNPYKVGDIYYDSWGWEQTNIDFYQIVEVGKKSVVIRQIGEIFVSGDRGWSEYVKPDKDNFVGEPQTKQVVFSRNGEHYIKGYRGEIMPYDHGDKGVHQSHYA